MPSHHVIAVAKNTLGNDYIATDTHGSLPLLQKMLAKLTMNDRLFLCGDLVDRGEDSLGVIQTLIEWNKTHPKQVQFIRGNHEDLALHAIAFLRFQEALCDSTEASWSDLSHHLSHDADKTFFESLSFANKEYLLAKFTQVNARVLNHPSTKAINTKKPDWHFLTENKLQEISLLNRYLDSIRNGGQWLFRLDTDQQQTVIDFITPAPYIIIIGTEALLFHADSPLPDAQLIELARTGQNLTPEQIAYVTWARADSDAFMPRIDGRNERTANSVRGYSGHSPYDPIKIRINTNTINLDIDSANNHQGLLINHTLGTVEIIISHATAANPLNDYMIRRDAQAIRRAISLTPDTQSTREALAIYEQEIITVYLKSYFDAIDQDTRKDLRDDDNDWFHENYQNYAHSKIVHKDLIPQFNHYHAKKIDEQILTKIQSRHNDIDTSALKSEYHSELMEMEQEQNKFTAAQRLALAKYLLTTPTHLLKKEARTNCVFFTRAAYSNETYSMYTVLKHLLKDLKKPKGDFYLSIQKGRITDVLSINLHDHNNEEQPIVLKRFGH